MSSTQGHEAGATERAQATVEASLEVIVVPVSDVDRSKRFYAALGWRLDADFSSEDGGRVVQFTPPGSACSVHFGANLIDAAPGSAQAFLVVADIDAARADLAQRGIGVTDVFHNRGFNRLDPAGRLPGPAPERGSYQSFVAFADPDGNVWLVQEITTRLPGRVDGTASYPSAAELAEGLRRAAAAHGAHEQREGGAFDANWPDWYAQYMVAEQAGAELPT